MGMFKEFKDFALRGNVVDMAVGVLIGGAFGKVVTSFIEDLVNPLLGLIGKVDFSTYNVPLRAAVSAPGDTEKVLYPAIEWKVGSFATTCINFAIMAFVIFMMVKMMNAAIQKKAAEPSDKPPTPAPDVVLLTEIRDLLKSRG